MAESVQGSVVVAAPPDRVLAVITDFARYPEWQRETTDAEVLATDGAGRGTRARFTFDAKVIRPTVVLDYEYHDDGVSWHLVEGDQVRRNDGRYRLVRRDDGSTEVTYVLALEPTVPLPGMVRRQAAKRIVDAGLQGLRRRVEAGGSAGVGERA